MVVDSTLTPSLPATGGSDPDLEPGQIVGEYQVEHKLGQGGFGAVFKAVHPLIGKQVAIKVLSHRFSVDPQMVSRFIAEARAVNQIRHPNIIDIFSFKALDDGRQYYVMEYLDGEPLDRRLARKGRMSLAEAIPILRGIARALDAAHAKGIAHRDLKAENVFLAAHPDGVFPKLLDFGIAKLLAPEDGLKHKTRTGAPMGTPHYMSPEQCHGRAVDHRTDMYAFGVLAYLMLTGAYPLDGDDYMAILMRQVHDEPVPPSTQQPDLPAGVDEAIAWLMRKDPAERPKTLMDAVRMLEQVAEEAGPAARSPGNSDALSTLPVEPSGNRTPPTKPARAGSSPPPGSRTPSGQRTPGGLAVPAISTTRPSGEAPAVRSEGEGAEAPPVAVRSAGPTSADRPRLPPHVLLGGGALLAAVAIVAVIAIRSGGRDAPTAPAPAPAPAPAELAGSAAAAPEAPATAPEAPAGSGSALPAHVFVTIEGAPPNTEVHLAGVPLGTVPGRVQVPRSGTEVMLVLSAEGYVPAQLVVVPSENLTRTVKLAPKAAAGGRPARPGGAARPAGGSAAKPAVGSAAKPPGGGSSVEPTNDIDDFPPKTP